jgi:hypothetical protein
MSKTLDELIEEKKAALQAKITPLQTKIDKLKEDLTPLENDLKELNKQISDLDDPAKILERAFGSEKKTSGGGGGRKPKTPFVDHSKKIVEVICANDGEMKAGEIKAAAGIEGISQIHWKTNIDAAVATGKIKHNGEKASSKSAYLKA